MKNLESVVESIDSKPSSSKSQETEIAVYAKITNPAGLDEAAEVEDQIQIEASFRTGHRIRIRKTIKADKTSIEQTIKVKNENAGLKGSVEYSIPVTEDYLEGFKLCAEKMLIKRRYVFYSNEVTLSQENENNEVLEHKLPNVKYEVDVYKRPDGEFSQWCKIDVELDSILNYIKSNNLNVGKLRLNVSVKHLPFRPTEPILNQEATPEQHKFMGSLWENEFNHRLNGSKQQA